jgi:hypothetical protein
LVEEDRPRDETPRDLTTWIAGRRSEVERWVEVTCQRAIIKVRSMLAEEIRGLSKRVDHMHELLDQLEQLVESQHELDEKAGEGDGQDDTDTH